VVPTKRPDEERKLVTVLFADLVGSTALGSRLDPEHLGAVTDAYFDAMRREIEAEGGTVEKYIGDAVMAVFGAPVAHEDDPTRALRAALRMRERLADVNRTLEDGHGVTLAMRIGVNTGDVLAVLRPRSEGRMVTGDAVNVAARLEQAAATGQILASERTVRAARGFRFAEIGPLRFKGKDHDVRAFEVVGATAGHEREAIPHAPMVGRRQETELLRTLYRRMVADRRPSLVTILGEAGIGKSRLADEFASWVEGLKRPPAFVQGRCLPYGEGVTYWPLAEILKRHARVPDSDPPESAIGKIRAAARTLLSEGSRGDVERTAAALAVTVGVEDPASPLRGLEPRQVRSELSMAWRSFFSALARPEPAVAVIHDLHWADPAMLDLLEELTDRIEAPVLFLSTARRELSAVRPGWGAGSRNFSGIMLEPLEPEDSRRLLEVLVADEEETIPDSVRERILERAGGNPFFIEQIVHHLTEARRHVGKPGSSVPEEVEIPDTVQAVLTARIDLLGPDEKRALRSAAVVGREFWSGSVGRLLDGETDGSERVVEDVLSRLEDRGLIMARLGSKMQGDREYVFRHILTRDVAYQSLPRRERQEAHARVAGWIEERARERRREFATLLAHHYTQAYRLAEDAGRDEADVDRLRSQAYRYAMVASEQARGKLALSTAENQAELALSLASSPAHRSSALEALGEAYFLDSDGDRAWAVFKEAVDLLLEAGPSDTRKLARLCAKALEVPTRGRGSMRSRLPREEAEPYLGIGMANVGLGDTEEGVRLLIARSFWPISLGEGRGTEEEELEARRSGEDAAAMAMRLGRPDLASAALDGVGQYYMGRGLYGQWAQLTEDRLDLAGSLSDPAELGDIFATASWCALHLGRYRDAERFASQGIDATLEAARPWLLYCLDFRAVARCRLGEWDSLREDAARIADILGDRTKQPPGYASDHLGAAAYVDEVQGDPAAADRLLEVITWLETEEERPSAGLAVWKTLLLARRGRFEDARASLDLPHTLWHGYARGIVLEARCDLLGEQGSWDEVEGVIEAARGHAEEAGLLALPSHADRLEGVAAGAAGDRDRAEALLRRALKGFTGLEAAWEAARTALALAESLADGEQRDEARQLLASARTVFERLRSVRELARAKELAQQLG